MTAYQCLVFLTVAETKSFSRSAQQLHVSPSAVSHIISKTEEEYGYALFIRNKNDVVLTSNGRIILPYVKQLLACNESLDQITMQLKNIEIGEVKIAAFNSVTALWLPPIISQFHTAHPNININIIQSGDLHIRELVDACEVDLALLPAELADNDDFIPLHVTPMMCLTPLSYTPRNGEYVTPDDLKDVPLIMQLEGYDTELKQYIKENHLSVHSNFRIEVDDTCHAFVEQGFGFCISSLLTASCNPRNVNIWPLHPPYIRTIGLITVRPEFISPATQLFRESMLTYLKEHDIINV